MTITPRFYSEARAIGEYYREGNPVIMNLSDMKSLKENVSSILLQALSLDMREQLSA